MMMPGWKPEDADVTLTGSTLTISGEMKEEEARPKQIKITATGDAQPERELVGAGAGR